MNINVNNMGTIAPLRNVVALAELIERMREREDGLPGMATFHGPSGFGKSTAMTWCVNRYKCYHIALKSVWRTKALCEAILMEMGISPAKTAAKMVDQISQELALSGRILILDEADHLIKNTLIEVVRDIYEGSGSGLILIGEENLPQKLSQWERFHGRMMDWVEALAVDFDDARLMASLFCRNLTIDDDVIAHILNASNGSARRVRVNLGKVADYARLHQRELIDVSCLNDVGFFTGMPPKRRVF